MRRDGDAAEVAMGARRRPKARRGVPTVWRVPDDLWKRIAVLLPIEEFRPMGGRQWVPPRRILDGVLYMLRTGCQWKAVPQEYGSGSTVHRRFQRWVKQGCFEAIWKRLLQHYDADVGLQWRWQSADASLHKAPLGGGKIRAQSHRSRQDRHQTPSRKPVDNAFVESFNGKFRDECLNEHWFRDLTDARQAIETWRVDYDCGRPHSSLGDRTPQEFATSLGLTR